MLLLLMDVTLLFEMGDFGGVDGADVAETVETALDVGGDASAPPDAMIVLLPLEVVVVVMDDVECFGC